MNTNMKLWIAVVALALTTGSLAGLVACMEIRRQSAIGVGRVMVRDLVPQRMTNDESARALTDMRRRTAENMRLIETIKVP